MKSGFVNEKCSKTDKGVEVAEVRLPMEVIYRLGLAVEAGCDEETQREAFGNLTVDIINDLHELPEFKKWCTGLKGY